jgi:hypothetical protein
MLEGNDSDRVRAAPLQEPSTHRGGFYTSEIGVPLQYLIFAKLPIDKVRRKG